MSPTDTTALAVHAARLAGQRLAGLFEADPGRAQRYARRLGPLLLEISRQPIDDLAWQALLAHAKQAGIEAARDAMFRGERVNRSEDRAALHAALRTPAIAAAAGAEIAATVEDGLRRTCALADDLRRRASRPGRAAISDVVSIGIGGSDLGPRLACQALEACRGDGPRLHFLANVDGDRAARLCARLDPARTAAIVISKSFGTRETLLNGQVMRDWLRQALGDEGARGHLFAVTARPERAADFGVETAHTLPMWDFVGGRYSLWSAVGLPVAVAIGVDGFRALLAGACAMDEHFAAAPLADNLPVWLALADTWNRDYLGRPSRCVVPYDDRLEALPCWLQQLEMESNGKRVRADGSPVLLPTAPVVWGSVGSNAQHAYFQALHQGCDVVPVEFIGVIRPAHELAENHRALLANMLAQAAALMHGKEPSTLSDGGDAGLALAAQQHFPGDRPSTTILLDRLDAHGLGMLLALYEHKVFVQSVLWGINAFDQWGVELGKVLANRIEPVLAGDAEDTGLDASTRHLAEQIRDRG